MQITPYTPLIARTYLLYLYTQAKQPPEGPRVAINTRHLCEDASDGPGAPRHLAPGLQNAACQGRFAQGAT